MKKLLTVILLLSLIFAKSQSSFRCNSAIAGPSLPTLPVGSCGHFLENFIPNPIGSNDTIDVNFIFFKPLTGPGIYSSVTLSQVQTIVTGVNTQWANFGSPHIVNTPAAGTITDSKIRFKLKTFSLIADSNAYKYPAWNNRPDHLKFAPYIDSTALNIFWSYDYLSTIGCGGGGHALDIGGNGIYMGLCGSQTPVGIDGLLGHEIGHALGLFHTFDGAYPPYTPAYIPTVLDLDYTKELGVKDTARNCTPVNDSSSNNIMAYNYKCRNYLSPEQVGAMRFLLQTYRPTYLLSKGTKPNICLVNHSKDSVYNSNKSLTKMRVFEGDVIINPGVEVTVDCEMWMSTNSKVIIKPGAKLIITPNGSFQSYCDGLWKGIEVWGDATQGQYIDAITGMPMYQGMVEMIGGKISDAVTGVTLGKRDSLDNPVIGSGGGIIQASNNSIVKNNYVGIEFFPYSFVSRNPLYNSNISFFKTTLFDNNNPGYSNVGFKTLSGKQPFAAVVLNDVHFIQFYGCSFKNNFIPGPLYGIKGINSSILMRDYCDSVVGTTCAGTLTQNTFGGGTSIGPYSYDVHLSNYSGFSNSVIEHVNFGDKSIKNIYLLNSNSTQITDCDFFVTAGGPTSPIIHYGIYLDNCTGYRIEDNNFIGTPTAARLKNVGIFVNNSGPFANSVYNNTFTNLEQGLWAQNQNVDIPSGIGLKMNCNDFTTCKYDIGVQKGGRYVTSAPNNTGVDFTQGVANTLNEPDNVRNVYSVVSCNTNAENKFFVNTANTFFTNHGSFLGSQFHPTPQTSNSCSDALELIDIVGSNNPASPVKSSYCPSAFTPTFSNSMLNSSATNQRELILAYSDTLATKVDGGSTTGLLASVNSGTMTWVNLKNLLVAKGPYLSDEVMLAYFSLNPPSGHVGQVHEVNAPVTPIVYNYIMGMSLPTPTVNRINENQDEDTLSARRLLEANLNLAKTELGLILNEKTRRLLADSAFNPIDSLIAIIQEGVATNTIEATKAEISLVQLYVATGQYTDANNLLTELEGKANPPLEFIELQELIIGVNSDPSTAFETINDVTNKGKLTDWSNSSDYRIEGASKALLAMINELVEEEMLSPEDPAGSRFASQKPQIEEVIELSNTVKIYPNPATDVLFIEMENNNSSLIEIRDITGKLVLSQNIEIKGAINVQNLQNGIYFINLVNGINLISSKKIAIIK